MDIAEGDVVEAVVVRWTQRGFEAVVHQAVRRSSTQLPVEGRISTGGGPQIGDFEREMGVIPVVNTMMTVME